MVLAVLIRAVGSGDGAARLKYTARHLDCLWATTVWSRPRRERRIPRRIGHPTRCFAAAARLCATSATGTTTALAILARHRDRLEAIAADIAARGAPAPVVIEADLSDPGRATALAEEAVDVDVLIKNAGGGAAGTTWRSGDGAPARAAFQVNYWAPMALVAALVPAMIERRQGTVITSFRWHK